MKMTDYTYPVKFDALALYQTLPEILRLFLDEHDAWRKMVLDHGDWGYYYSIRDDDFSPSFILNVILRPQLLTVDVRSKWSEMCDQCDEYLNGWDSL